MTIWRRHPVPTLALLAVLVGGALLLVRADAQARDTIRKHHLQDIETALYTARAVHGTYPPYDAPTWCGMLSAPESAAVTQQVEAALRAQNEKYENLAKPFPTDPRAAQRGPTYVYHKHSPASFSLLTQLEADSNGMFDISMCGDDGLFETPHPYPLPARGVRGATVNYGLVSVLREDLPPEL